jgi:hypothetical protein
MLSERDMILLEHMRARGCSAGHAVAYEDLAGIEADMLETDSRGFVYSLEIGLRRLMERSLVWYDGCRGYRFAEEWVGADD